MGPPTLSDLFIVNICFLQSSLDYSTPLRVRTGPQKKPPGFQAHLVCLTPLTNGELPSQITSLSINSSYGLWVPSCSYG